MAFEYQNYANLGVNLNRQKYGPLDISNVFTSQTDLNYYLSKGALTENVSAYWLGIVPYPYEGQILALVSASHAQAFIITHWDAENNIYATEAIESAGSLQELISRVTALENKVQAIEDIDTLILDGGSAPEPEEEGE